MYNTVQSKLLLVFLSEHQLEIDKYKVYSFTVLCTADFLSINLFCRDYNTIKIMYKVLFSSFSFAFNNHNFEPTKGTLSLIH